MEILPKNGEKTEWPPKDWGKSYEQIWEHAAWYSGDTGELIQFYSSNLFTPSANGRFWGENVMSDDKRTVIHVPMAGDIASFSADMLFSEMPEFKIPEADQRNENDELIPNQRATEAQKRLDEIVRKGDILTRLLEAGETSAALGGVYLKPTWNTKVSDVPLMVVAQPDNAIPVFKYGMLVACTFWNVLSSEVGKVVRLLEHHTRGQWENAVYIGDNTVLGRRVSDEELLNQYGLEPVVPTSIDKLLVRYVPNKRPHKRFRGSDIGMSDLQGLETLMDSLDMTMTSWMRDIRLGRARIFMAQDMLENDGKGNVRFDGGQELFIGLDMDPADSGDGSSPITASQFQIRTDDHYKTATELITKILNLAGYAPQSFGLNLDGNISTESHEIRERKTLITKQKKERFFKEALADVCQMLLEIDNIHLGKSTPTEFRPNITFSDVLGHNISSVADTVQKITQARAASIKTAVQMLHPDWSPEEVAAEVSRIREDDSAGDPLTIGGKEYPVDV